MAGNVQASLDKIMEIDGCIACAVVDATSGMLLGQAGSGVDMNIAAAGNSEVVRAKVKTMKSLNLNDQIEDIMITLSKAYHLIRTHGNLFVYVVLNKAKANLALARHKLDEVEGQLSV
jgi:predicted regulator of Ras-like GTPase activity (Roadblock/LC7/MglB family)